MGESRGGDFGTQGAGVEVEARGREFWELNNPSDVGKLESMMQRMGIA